MDDEEEERVLEVIMLSLRTKDGLNIETLKSQHRRAVIDALLPYYHHHQYKDMNGQYCDSTGVALTDDRKELVQFFFNQSTDDDDNNEGKSLLLGCDGAAGEQEQKAAGAADDGRRRKRVIQESATRVRLVDPDGFLLSNDIISSVFAAIMS